MYEHEAPTSIIVCKSWLVGRQQWCLYKTLHKRIVTQNYCLFTRHLYSWWLNIFWHLLTIVLEQGSILLVYVPDLDITLLLGEGSLYLWTVQANDSTVLLLLLSLDTCEPVIYTLKVGIEQYYFKDCRIKKIAFCCSKQDTWFLFWVWNRLCFCVTCLKKLSDIISRSVCLSVHLHVSPGSIGLLLLGTLVLLRTLVVFSRWNCLYMIVLLDALLIEIRRLGWDQN